ncbi:MAG: DMT family transporter [Anaerolineales bacterium]|nr:DMT family transporter [Anaerolineales bacterium]
MNPQVGALAAIVTAIFWSATSTFFTLAGREVGSVIVNRARLLLASSFLLATHWIVMGEPLPLSALPEQWFWLALSGLIGFVLGDAFLFQAFVWIGPRLSMLMMSLAPIIAAVVSWFILGERLAVIQIGGIALAISGVVVVMLDRRAGATTVENKDYFRGLLFGLGAASGQALGLIASKLGLAGGLSPLSGNTIRVLTATSILWLVTLVMRQGKSTFDALLAQKQARFAILGGTVFGPFLGVWLSLVAIQNSPVGIASTLMGLSPIFLVPIGRIVFNESFTWRTLAGTLAAIGGVALLFVT